MIPYFNTSGPCIPGKHYMLSPEHRLRHVLRLVDEEKYFTIHAGRQTGKTTMLRWIADHFNRGNRYRVLWVDVETARDIDDPAEAIPTMLRCFDDAIEWAGLTEEMTLPWKQWVEDPESAMLLALRHLSRESDRPLVVLFDEADSLIGRTMVTFLTQLRKGYLARDRVPFPYSVALVGQRQVRDYVFRDEDRRAVAWLGSTSPFNITAEAATLRMFTRDEVAELLDQHTEKTGQRFSQEAVEHLFYLSQGHPWLVNAIADQVVNRDVEDRSVEVTKDHIEAAKETIIVERRSHIDSLLARLREERVKRIIDPMIAGERATYENLDDDAAYVKGLGLVVERGGTWQVANPVYREVILRTLTYSQQMQIANEPAWYVTKDGKLEMRKLMEAWQKFWRKDGHLAAEGFGYRESGPHLMLMAFLQRIVNGGGRIEREYGLGRGALDLLVEFGGERHAIEVKVRRHERSEEKGLKQLTRYLDHLGSQEGWLVLFDLRKERKWEDKLFIRDETREGKLIHVVGA